MTAITVVYVHYCDDSFNKCALYADDFNVYFDDLGFMLMSVVFMLTKAVLC